MKNNEVGTHDDTILVEPKGESRQNDPELTMQIVTNPISRIAGVLEEELMGGNKKFIELVSEYIRTGQITDDLKKNIYVILGKAGDITIGPHIIDYFKQIFEKVAEMNCDRAAELLLEEQNGKNPKMAFLTMKYSKALEVSDEIRGLASDVLGKHSSISIVIGSDMLLKIALSKYLEKIGVNIELARKRIRSIRG